MLKISITCVCFSYKNGVHVLNRTESFLFNFNRMFYYFIWLLLFSSRFFSLAVGENLSGIFVLDSCECSPTSEDSCELKGPFIFDHQRSSLAVRYGSIQIGVGTLDQEQRLDLYFNKNRCKGFWNNKSLLAEFKCQQKDGTICAIKLRCASGTCLSNRAAIELSSSSSTNTISFLIIVPLFVLNFFI